MKNRYNKSIMSVSCVKLISKCCIDTIILNIESEIEFLINYNFLDKKRYNCFKNGIGKNKFNQTRADKPFIKNGYQYHFYFYIGNKYFLISYGPKTSFLPYARITTHLTAYKSLEDFKATLVFIWNYDVADYLFYKSVPTRIDFCADTENSIDKTIQMAFRPNIRWSRETCSNIESLSLGVLSTNSNQIVIYEKKNTRIEARFTGKEIPINHISDLYNLKDFNPFHNIHLYDFNINRIELSKYKPKQLQIIQEFSDKYHQRGYFMARKRMNKNRNFYSTVKPKIEEGIKTLEIYPAWKTNFELFCSPPERINTSALGMASNRYQITKKINSFILENNIYKDSSYTQGNPHV